LHKLTKQVFSSLLVLILVATSFFLPVSSTAASESKTLRVLETSDLHGQIENWDYYLDTAITSSKRGLGSVSTYVNQVRAANPNTILIDDGDTIEGTPVNHLYNEVRTTDPNPMDVAMNFIGYTAATLGNHEFNFNKTVVAKYMSTASFPFVVGNVRNIADNSLVFQPYIIKEIDGVQVGILGFTNENVPTWEKPENYAGWYFTNAAVEAAVFVPAMKAAGADVIVIALHNGSGEAGQIANAVPNVDVILAGHSHSNVNTLVNGVLIVEPTNAGQYMSDVTLNLSGSGSDWAVSSKSAVNVSMNSVAENPAYLAVMKPYHDTTREYINAVIGNALGDFPSGNAARWKDSATVDLVNLVQTEWAASAGFPVDASCTALFRTDAGFPPGPIKLKDVYKLYIYDNTVYVLEVTGQMVKDEMEWSAGSFNQYYFSPTGPTGSLNTYYDMFSGIEYRLDVTKPVGQRIVDLRLNGEPLRMDQTLRLAANNYRSVSQFIPRGAILIHESQTQVRDLVVNYVQAHLPLDPNAIYVHNWDLLPNPDLWIYPNITMTKTDYLNLVNFAFGDPTSSAFFVGDRQKRTGLIFDPVEKDFVFLNNDKSFGEHLVPNAVISGNRIKFTYLGSDLRVRADINLAGTSVVTADDLAGGKSYLLQSSENGNVFNTERALAYLVNESMSSLVSPVADWTKLQTYSDWKLVSPWAGSAYTFMTGTLTFAKLAPLSPVTNSNALKWIQEARFPLVSFITTSDFHGQLDPITVSSTLMGSAAVDTTYIKNYKARNPLGSVLVDSGDTMQGTLISNYFKGSSTIDVFNTMGYQASALGNHDFDWGQPILQQRLAQAQYPWLCCNVFTAGSNDRPAWVTPSAIIEVKGLKIGLIGAITMETPMIVMPSSIAGLEFRPAAPIINQIAADLRAQGVKMIVVLAHIGGSQDSRRVITGEVAVLANNLVGVNYIASGHSHVALNSAVNNIPITQPYSSGSALGLADIRVDRLTGTNVNYTLAVNSTYDLGITPDPTVAAMVAGYNATIAVIKNQPVGTITGPILRNTPDRYTAESEVGNLCTDAQAWKGGVTIAFTNPGGIRADIKSPVGVYPYNVTWNDMYTVQPFDNLVTLMDLTGAQIKAVLEQCFPPVATSTKMLQVSGIKYTVQLSAPANAKIIGLTLADGTPINPATTYRVAVNNFLATGGDGFSVFIQGTNQFNTGISDITALVDYVLWKWGTPPANTPFSSPLQGRITVVP
jgi:2',3'-cyclic-nucleotide 2'-phosphodiesterase/3'-nucleotidase/5'-nucleotidase